MRIDPGASRVFYVDDHFISCTGAQPAGKGWNNRRGRAEKGRFDTLVTGRGGAAADWSAAAPSGLSRTLPPALDRLRAAVGPDRPLLLGFDRGGAYPQVFTQIRAQHADWITCRRAPLAPTAQLPVLTTITRSGSTVPVAVADELVTLDGYDNGGGSGVCRQLSVFEHGKVVLQVLTSDLDSCAAWLLMELIGRWGIENVAVGGVHHPSAEKSRSSTTRPSALKRSKDTPARSSVPPSLSLVWAVQRTAA